MLIKLVCAGQGCDFGLLRQNYSRLPTTNRHLVKNDIPIRQFRMALSKKMNAIR
jgi:hypothetical protein